jgi:hypothetical protein
MSYAKLCFYAFLVGCALALFLLIVGHYRQLGVTYATHTHHTNHVVQLDSIQMGGHVYEVVHQ